MIVLKYPLVSALILNFNGKEKLADILTRCVSSVLNSDYSNLEVIFFDNGSTDDSIEFVKKEIQTSAKLRIIAISRNRGPVTGLNKAMEYARGKYTVLLNNDVEVEPDSIRKLVDAMESDSTIGIAQSKILFFDRLHIQSAGNMLDLTLTARLIGYAEEAEGEYESVIETTFAHGACMILRKSMIERIGLFDPDYFFYHDDVDFSLRARLAGFKVVCVPTSIVYHKGGGTISDSFMRHADWHYSLNSRIGLLIKNLEFTSILKIGIPVFMNNILIMYGLVVHGNSILALKSAAWFFKSLRNNLRLRQVVQNRIRKIPDEDLFEHFLDYSIWLLHLKWTRPLCWIAKPKDSLGESISRVLDVYYHDHKAGTQMR